MLFSLRAEGDELINELAPRAFRELVVWIELRHRQSVTNPSADLQSEIRFLNHGGEIPIIAELV